MSLNVNDDFFKDEQKKSVYNCKIEKLKKNNHGNKKYLCYKNRRY